MELVETVVQSVHTEAFASLKPNDILFIDSSHVAKIGSDVNYLVFETLPRLKPGVVHVHDVMWPFELYLVQRQLEKVRVAANEWVWLLWLRLALRVSLAWRSFWSRAAKMASCLPASLSAGVM